MPNTNAALPPKNHNNPPSDVEILQEQLTLRHVHAMRAAESHFQIANQMPDHFTEENEATYTSDFIKLMQNCSKEFERRRKEEKEPFLRQGQYVDSFFGEYIDKLKDAIDKAKRPLDDWLRRKAHAEQEEREAVAKLLREREEAALRAAAGINREEVTQAEAAQIVTNAVEAVHSAKVAEAIAAAPVTSMARTTGTRSTAGLAMKWTGTITDVDQLDLHKLRPYIAAAELQKALDRYVKQGGRQCDGASIVEVVDVKVK